MHKILDSTTKITAGSTTWRQENGNAVATIRGRRIKQYENASQAVFIQEMDLVFPNTNIDHLTIDVRNYIIRAAVVELAARARAKKDKKFLFTLAEIAEWDSLDMSAEGLMTKLKKTASKTPLSLLEKLCRTLGWDSENLSSSQRAAIETMLEAE